jgi:hypothetical protein
MHTLNFKECMQMSADPNTDPSTLLPVPTFLFQGSIVLGSLCEAVLGVSTTGKQLVHPALIAGWCGLFTQVRNSRFKSRRVRHVRRMNF